MYRGAVIDAGLIAPEFMVGNETEEETKPWYQRRIYYDRHSSFVQLHRQWYFYSNDYRSMQRVHPLSPLSPLSEPYQHKNTATSTPPPPPHPSKTHTLNTVTYHPFL